MNKGIRILAAINLALVVSTIQVPLLHAAEPSPSRAAMRGLYGQLMPWFHCSVGVTNIMNEVQHNVARPTLARDSTEVAGICSHARAQLARLHLPYVLRPYPAAHKLIALARADVAEGQLAAKSIKLLATRRLSNAELSTLSSQYEAFLRDGAIMSDLMKQLNRI